MNEDYKIVVEVASLAGKIMLESHAESYRAEDTVKRILQASGVQTAEVISNSTALFITIDDEFMEPITVVQRITERGNHLGKIYRVNNISRQLTSNQLTYEEAYSSLLHIQKTEYSVLDKDISNAILVVSFVVLLGGTIPEILIGVPTALIVIFVMWLQDKMGMNDFILGTLTTAFLGFLVPMMTWAVGGNLNYDIIIVSALMPLFPGTAFTYGVRDILKGDYSSGLVRMTEAIVIGLSLALGVAFGLYLSTEVLIPWLA